jgi:hypothetical protein
MRRVRSSFQSNTLEAVTREEGEGRRQGTWRRTEETERKAKEEQKMERHLEGSKRNPPVLIFVHVLLKNSVKIKFFPLGHHEIIIRECVLDVKRASEFVLGSLCEFPGPKFLHGFYDFGVEKMGHVGGNVSAWETQ